MGLTGVIYAAIVVAWAIFLIPLALRRHDQTARNRSIERFSSTMRVLSTGGRRVGSRMVLSPPRSTEQAGSSSQAAPKRSDLPAGATRAEPGAVRLPARPGSKAAAARRRRVLRVLVALTLLTAVFALLGVIAAWSVVVPLLVIVAFLAMARRQVRLANEAYWEQASTDRPTASNVVQRAAARVDASHGVARDVSTGERAPERSSVGDEVSADDDESEGGDESDGGETGDPNDEEPTITLTAAQLAAGAAALAQDRAVAVSMSTSDGGSLWDPLPITLPTYVSQAVAKRSVRNIALGEAGTWSSGHSAEASAAVAGAATDVGESEAAHADEGAQRAANA